MNSFAFQRSTVCFQCGFLEEAGTKHACRQDAEELAEKKSADTSFRLAASPMKTGTPLRFLGWLTIVYSLVLMGAGLFNDSRGLFIGSLVWMALGYLLINVRTSVTQSIPGWRKILGGIVGTIGVLTVPGAFIALLRPPVDVYSMADMAIAFAILLLGTGLAEL